MTAATEINPTGAGQTALRAPTTGAGLDCDPRPAPSFFASAGVRVAGGRSGGEVHTPLASVPPVFAVARAKTLPRYAVSRAPDGAPLFFVPLHNLGDTRA